MRHARNIILFVLLQFVIDRVFVSIYASVNPIRATFIGLTAFAILAVPPIRRYLNRDAITGALAIYSSALFGALLVQTGYLLSKSAFSAFIHVVILVVTYGLAILLRNVFAGRRTSI